MSLLSLPALAADGGGTVQGTITLQGAGGDVRKAVVYIPDFEEDPPSDVGGTIAQKDKQYVPDVLPIVKGQKVIFDNQDPFLHNVFSSSRAAGRNMDLGRYSAPKTKFWRFKTAGVVDVYCDIHEQMRANVVVLPNHAFAQPDAKGHYTIKNVPPGRHPIYVWYRDAEKVGADVVVESGKVAQVQPLTVVTVETDPSHKDKFGQAYANHPAGYDQKR